MKSLLVMLLVLVPAIAAAGPENRPVAPGEVCFEATVVWGQGHAESTQVTTLSADDVPVPITFADAFKVYGPLTADPDHVDFTGELVESDGLLGFLWSKGGAGDTHRLNVSYHITFQSPRSDTGDYLHFQVGVDNQCPLDSGTPSNNYGGTFAGVHTGVRNANGVGIFDVDNGQCFGLMVDPTDFTAGDDVTMRGVTMNIRQVSTKERPCR